MNIIWVSLYPPLPLNFGGPVGIYHRVKEISKHKNSIYLFYINDDDNDYDQELNHYCKEVHSYKRNKKNLELLFNCLRYPYTVATRNIRILQDDIEKCIQNEKIDLINIEFPQMCVNILGFCNKYNIPIILHEHNNEWSRFSQMAEASNGLRKIFLRIESRRLFHFEKKIEKTGSINYYSFLSTADQKNHIRFMNVNSERTFLVPLGGEYKPLPEKKHEGTIFVFCAAMDSEMNEEAALWFAKEVFNRLDRDNCKLYIVGRNPSEHIYNIQSTNIIVTGSVASLEVYYSIADVVVIPLLHGGGVKVKLMEAIGYGKLVLTTSVGSEGTIFSKDNILIADNAEQMIDQCNRIIDGDYDLKVIKQKMINLFCCNYQWSAIGDEYNLRMKTIALGKDLL